jgi:hypothetical protein
MIFGKDSVSASCQERTPDELAEPSAGDLERSRDSPDLVRFRDRHLLDAATR